MESHISTADLGPELVEVDVHALDILPLLRHLAEVLGQLQLRLQNLHSFYKTGNDKHDLTKS